MVEHDEDLFGRPIGETLGADVVKHEQSGIEHLIELIRIGIVVDALSELSEERGGVDEADAARLANGSHSQKAGEHGLAGADVAAKVDGFAVFECGYGFCDGFAIVVVDAIVLIESALDVAPRDSAFQAALLKLALFFLFLLGEVVFDGNVTDGSARDDFSGESAYEQAEGTSSVLACVEPGAILAVRLLLAHFAADFLDVASEGKAFGFGVLLQVLLLVFGVLPFPRHLIGFVLRVGLGSGIGFVPFPFAVPYPFTFPVRLPCG